ncbi:MAG: helix-turn-helix transcriptional regulator [Cyanobacteria bacterium J06633_2]
MTLVSKISALRDKRGLTQREVALHVGVTETTISNWESGRSGLDWIDRIIKLCEILQCDLNDLIEQEKDDEPSLEELRAMYKAGLLKTPKQKR